MAGMVPEDVYELTGVSDPRVSPDGRRIAYVVWRTDRESNETTSAIWIAAADGSSEPRRLTSGSKRDAAPRWSPDGSRLAFVSNREDEHSQLYLIRVDGGEPVKVTSCKQDVEEPAWSPDGSRIAFAGRVPDPGYEVKDDRKRPPRRFTRLQYKLDNEGWIGDRPRHVFVVPVDGGGEPVQVTTGGFEDGEPAWSPEGGRIAFASARHDDWDVDDARDLYVVDSSGGDPERLTATDGVVDRPSWSPDGTRIAYILKPGVLDEPRHAQVAVLDVRTRERRVLTDGLDRNCAPYPAAREPIWDRDDLLFAVDDAGNTHLFRVPSDGSGKPENVVGGTLQVVGYDAAGGTVAYARTTPTEPAEVFVGDSKLTDVGRAFREARELVAPERFTATSADGTEVEAWIMRPAGFEEGRRYPALLNIHGGPFTQYGNRFFDEFQVYAGGGYAVVYANPRGSSGYGEEWGRAIRGPIEGGPGWGTVDYEDLMAVTDEALRRYDFIDAGRLGVLGGSYGGYMTSWIVGHTDRFAAACSERSCNNFLLEGGSADLGWMFKGEIGGFWFEHPDEYMRISPSTYAKNVTTPLLIMHSENDLRCPIGHAEDLFAILRLLRREVEMVLFPVESHELTRSGSPAHRVQRFEIMLEWFDRHLTG